MVERQPIYRAKQTAAGLIRMRTLQVSELTWVEHLRAKHLSNQIGFVPTAAYADRLRRGDLLHIALDGQDAGFVLVGAGTRRPLRISQLAVHPDLWAQRIGPTCINWLLRHARALPYGGPLIADVRDDLDRMKRACERTGGKIISTAKNDTARGKPLHRFLWLEKIDESDTTSGTQGQRPRNGQKRP